MGKKSIFKFLSLLMAVLIVMGPVGNMAYSAETMPTTGSEGQRFKDVPRTEWYYDYVMCLANRGVVHGYGDTDEYRPYNLATREHAAKMVARAAGLDFQNKKADFPDVDPDSEMSPYIAALVDSGAVRGFLDGSFRPKDFLKRGHAAKIVQIAFKLKESTKEVKILDYLTHDAQVTQAIKVLASNGIIKGYGDSNLFKPDKEINRAELAKMLCIAATVAAVQEAEDLRTPDAISHAQALVDNLSGTQDTDTKDYLQERLDTLKEPSEPDSKPNPDPEPEPEPEPLISLEADDEIPFGYKDAGFTMTFKASSMNELKNLVIVNDLGDSIIPDFTLYPDETDMWRDLGLANKAAGLGITGSYDATSKEWKLIFGPTPKIADAAITKMRDVLWDQIKDRVVFCSYVEDVEGNQSGSLENDTCEKTEVIFEVCAVHSFVDGGVTITVGPGRLGGYLYGWQRIPFSGKVVESDSKIELRSCAGDLFFGPAATGFLDFSITGRPDRKLDVEIGSSQAGKQIVNLNEFWKIPGKSVDYIPYEPVAYALITDVAKDSEGGETLTLHAVWNESENKLKWEERVSNADFPLTAVTLNSVLTSLDFSFEKDDDLKNLVIFDKDNDGSKIYYSKGGKFTIQWKWPFEGPGGGNDPVTGSWGPKTNGKIGVMNYDDADTYITKYMSDANINFDFCIEIK